jgi:hypothetical protein
MMHGAYSVKLTDIFKLSYFLIDFALSFHPLLAFYCYVANCS